MSCFPLASILDKISVTHIDFFSLDVEGAELAVLRTLDFSTFSFNVGVIEDNSSGANGEPPDAIISFLGAQGYLFHGKVVRNLWFVHPHFRAHAKASVT